MISMPFSYLYDLSYFFFNNTSTTDIYTLSLHDALPISHPFLRRDGGNLGEETLGGALRQAQLEARFLGRDHAQQLRIERPQRLHVHVNGFGHQPQVNRMAGLDRVGANWRLWVHLEAIPLRIFGHQSEGEDDQIGRAHV